MTTVRLHSALLGLTFLGAMALNPAAAFANCGWYVKTSLEQQQRNLKMGCGFTGPQWSLDKNTHESWCSGVGPDVSRKAAQNREKMLSTCK